MNRGLRVEVSPGTSEPIRGWVRLGMRRRQRFRPWGRDGTRFWKRVRLGDERFGVRYHNDACLTVLLKTADVRKIPAKFQSVNTGILRDVLQGTSGLGAFPLAFGFSWSRRRWNGRME